MSEVQGPDPSDDIDERYRRASAADDSQPSDAVRRAVLTHAAQLAAQRSARTEVAPHPTQRAPVRRRWQPAVFGSLAAAALAAVVIAPRFLWTARPSAQTEPPPTARSSPAESKDAQAGAQAQSARAPEAAPAPPLAKSATPRLKEPEPFPAAPVPQASKPQVPLSARVEATAAAGQAGNQAEAKQAEAARAEARQADTSVEGVTEAPVARAAAVAPVPPRFDASALWHAAGTGDVAQVQALLEQQPDVNVRDAEGRTALMLATVHGQAEVVALLLKHGADPNVADAHGVTPLRAAVDGNERVIVAALRRAGGH
jgi:hypothetical protein